MFNTEHHSVNAIPCTDKHTWVMRETITSLYRVYFCKALNLIKFAENIRRLLSIPVCVGYVVRMSLTGTLHDGDNNCVNTWLPVDLKSLAALNIYSRTVKPYLPIYTIAQRQDAF